MQFQSLGLAEPICRAIKKEGYTVPTEIQKAAIPVILSGRDVLAAAQTGTGKTASFALPILENLLARRQDSESGNAPHKNAGHRKRELRVLILTPTRELAAQVNESVRAYGQFTKIHSTVVFGGVSIQPQIQALKNGTDILVATPGRLLDLADQKKVDLSRIDTLVLDEADRMLDMGFIRDIRRVLALLPKKRQNLLFSATFSQAILKLTEGLLHKPERIQATPNSSAAVTVDQKVYTVEKDGKVGLLKRLINDGDWQQVLVFTRTKHGANRLTQKLEQSGISAAAIHGNKSQGARTKALAGFKDRQVRVLVATDIAARGLDIEQLPQVVNFDLPNVPEDYVHRIGRTGRAGSPGHAASLVSREEMPLLKNIEKVIKKRLQPTTIAAK
ncbi:MAG: DEAD/DEAH box helicase [Leptospiraceae bacterium]|nr:DEAD/DEAH box helicase [Leptospiraceae bacterium]